MWLQRRAGEETRLRRTFQDLIELCRKREAGGLLSTALHAQDILGYFTSNATIRVGPPYAMTLDRGDLPGLLARAHHHVDALDVRLRGDEIDLGTDRSTAEMRATIEIEVRMDGNIDQGIGEYRLTWRKADREWRIHDVEHLETIRHPVAPIEP